MPDMVKLILLIVFEIPAIVISVLIFIYFITQHAARSKPKNHVWLVLLFVSFLQIIVHIPMSMSFYYLDKVWPTTDSYCVWWNWFEHATTSISLILMAWASIERHFFIFHPTFIVGGTWKKWMFHIIPIILCILWTLLWYLVLIVVSPNCTNVWDFEHIVCGGLPCYTTGNDEIYDLYGILDVILTIVIPLSVIILANIGLMIRVIFEKISRHQAIRWNRHRKMVFQLWCISTLYFAPWLPIAIALLIRFIALPTFLNDQTGTLIYATNFVPLLLPFVCLGVFPEILKSIRDILERRRRNQIRIVSARPQIQMRTGHE